MWTLTYLYPSYPEYNAWNLEGSYNLLTECETKYIFVGERAFQVKEKFL